MSVTSVGIRAREGREMGPMGPGILKTVQSAHGVATIRGARDNAIRSGAPGNEARTSAAAPKPETRAWWGSRPIPPRQPPPLTCREVTSPNRPLSRPRLRLRDRAAQRTQQAQHHSGPYSSEAQRTQQGSPPPRPWHGPRIHLLEFAKGAFSFFLSYLSFSATQGSRFVCLCFAEIKGDTI